MFTGLVEELGTVKGIVKGEQSVRLTIQARKVLEDVKLGDSIAVNGTCLTVVAYNQEWFTADVMPETVNRTVLAYLKPGEKVNCERTLRVGDRLGGHIVSGHIDGVGRIIHKEKNDIAMIITIAAEPQILCYIIPKGSIAIDGISLTVVSVTEADFTVSLIPHTAAETTLGIKKVGEMVNLETDVIGKYVEKLLTNPSNSIDQHKQSKQNLSLDFLAKNGFIS